MTFKEFRAQNRPCEECSAYIEGICTGGDIWVGDGFDVPPCEIFSNKDIDKWVEDVIKTRQQFEEAEERKQAEALRKKEIARKRAETARQMKSYCYAERKQVARLKKAVKSLETAIREREIFAESVNEVNEMFGYSGRIPQLDPQCYAELDFLKQQLKVAEKKYKAKRKEFYANRRNNGQAKRN